MRFLGQRITKKEETVFDFAVGGSELRMMYEILNEAFLKMPKLLEIQTTRHRLNSMIKEMWLQIRANNIKK